MKAFVIKNKEGKYFAGFDNLNVFVTEKDITNAVIYRADRYKKYELENTPEFEDCEVVEITIAEGDLEHQIRKQICDEIREKLKAHCDYTNDIGWYITEEKIDIILNQIEKGE